MNAGASGVSDAKMKRLLEEDKERLDFEEDHMVRLVRCSHSLLSVNALPFRSC